MRAESRGPSEQAKAGLQVFLGNLGPLAQLLQLLAELLQLAVNQEGSSFSAEAEGPATPGDAWTKLCLFAADGRVKSCEQCNDEAHRLVHIAFAEECKDIIYVYVKQSFMWMIAEQCVNAAQDE